MCLFFEVFYEFFAKSWLPEMTHHVLDALIALAKLNSLALIAKVVANLLLNVEDYDVVSWRLITVDGKEKVVLLQVVRRIVQEIDVFFVRANCELGVL